MGLLAAQTLVNAICAGTVSAAQLETKLTTGGLLGDFQAIICQSGQCSRIANTPAGITAIIGSATALNAVVTSSSAMKAIAGSDQAMNAFIINSTALNKIVITKIAMTEIADSSNAMGIVAGSQTAMAAVLGSTIAVTAIANNDTAMNSIADNTAAMASLVASQTAMNVISANKGAMTAISTRAPAMNVFFSSAFAVGNGLNTVMQIGVSQIIDSSNSVPPGKETFGAVVVSSMSVIAYNPVLMKLIAASPNAMNIIIGIAGAMSTIAASPIAMSAIVGNTSAITTIWGNNGASNAVMTNQMARVAIYNSKNALIALQANPAQVQTLVTTLGVHRSLATASGNIVPSGTELILLRRYYTVQDSDYLQWSSVFGNAMTPTNVSLYSSIAYQFNSGTYVRNTAAAIANDNSSNCVCSCCGLERTQSDNTSTLHVYYIVV